MLPRMIAAFRQGLLLAGSILLLGLSTPLLAQSEDEELDTIPVPQDPARGPAEDAPPDEEVLDFDAVVISATPTADTLSQTPISVTVTTDTELRETNITDLENLSDRLPNAQLALTPTNTFLFVRGLGTGSVRSAEQSVGFFVDGVYLGRPQVALFDFLDLAQVELLRGPQGAILGKNTVAGAVNVRTASATPYTEGYAEFLGGNDDRRRGRGAISGSITDTLAGRIAYSETREDGFLFNTTQQRVDLARPGRGGRGKLQWTPTDTVIADLTVQSAEITQNGDSFELSQASDEVLQLYREFDPETTDDITDRRTHTDHVPSGAVIDGSDVIARVEWAPDIGTFRLLGSTSEQEVAADLDLDISPAPFLTLPSFETYRQRSVELRFDKQTGWGDYSAGVFWFRSDLDLSVDIVVFNDGSDAFVAPLLNANAPGSGDAAVAVTGALGPALGATGIDDLAGLGRGASLHRLVQEQTTYSTFGSVRWYWGERWTLRADARLTRETKAGDQVLEHQGTTGQALGEALGEEEYALVAERTETDFSPRLSVLTEITPTISSYVTLARGFKSGGFNNLAAVPERAEFEDENSETVEAGLRVQTDFGVSGSLGLFRTRFDNLQVAALDGTEFFVGNAAEATTQGAELSARWDSDFGVFVAADLGYLDAEYDRYVGAPARADQSSGPGEPPPSQDLSGRTLQRAPRWSGSLQVGALSKLPWVGLPVGIGAVAEGASHQFLNIDLDPIDSQPGYVRYNAFAGISDADQRFTLRLIGRNLTDRIVRREAADVALVGAHQVGLFPPRTVSLEAGYRF